MEALLRKVGVLYCDSASSNVYHRTQVNPDLEIPEESNDTDSGGTSLSEDDSSDEERSDLTYVVPPFLATPPPDSADDLDEEDSQIARDTDDALSHLSVEWGTDAEQLFGSSSPYRILENALDMHQFLGLPPLNVATSSHEQPACLCPLLCPAHPVSIAFLATIDI